MSDRIDTFDKLADIVQRAHGIGAAIFGTLSTQDKDTIKGVHALYLDHLQSLIEFNEQIQESWDEHEEPARPAVDEAGSPR
jgi:hypothetical protein